jgi:mRNA interferase MazF
VAGAYVPDRGDLVWLQFTPQRGHEQAGLRPALVLSPRAYNRKVGLALACPVTSQVKGYPFEVTLPDGLAARGAVLCDQIKSVDWRARKARRLDHVPAGVMVEVTARVVALVDPE